MIWAPVRSCVFLTLLLHGCLDAFMQNDPVLAWQRERVLRISVNEPCSRGGFWFTLDDTIKAEANHNCEEAYWSFQGLNNEEQSSCPNAVEPSCRPGFGCNALEHRCTFLCDTEVEVWRRHEKGRPKRLEKVVEIKRMPKDLRSIARTVEEPQILPEGYQPFPYSRGRKRVTVAMDDL